MNIYIYPPLAPVDEKAVNNPYMSNFIKGLSKTNKKILNSKHPVNISIIDLSKKVFSVDFLILNWIEYLGTRKYGTIQFLIFLFLFPILLFRKVKILWIIHDIHPHQGETFISSFIKKLMLNYATILVTHSKAAKNYFQNKTKKNIHFFHHPIDLENYNLENSGNSENTTKSYEILIWGSIEPYKGILEFLQFVNEKNLNWKIKIVGKCKNENYENEISKYFNSNIEFENKIASFNEIYQLVKLSKFVLMPYKSTSVSSSGILMDSFCLGANVIGPNKGAFADMHNLNLCHVYDNYEDLIEIINNYSTFDKKHLNNFLETIKWSEFSKSIINLVK